MAAKKCSCKHKTTKVHEAKKRAAKAKGKHSATKAKASKLKAAKGCRC